jgi:hypothetical protein
MDLSHYDDCNDHNGWEVEEIFELPNKLPTINDAASRKFRKLSKKLGFRIKEGKEAYFKESSFTSKFGHWKGYWQSYKYFHSSEKLIRSNFVFKNRKDIESTSIAKQIKSSESVSIHIRRGDYLTGKNSESFGGICTEAYYTKAIELLNAQVPNAHFYIFSDDKDWCLKQFDSDKFTVVEGFSGKDSWKDMFLMSLCKHSIIANSSFSWWGMYLGNQLNRVAVGPNKFLNDELVHSKIQDFLPPTVYRISNKGVVEYSPQKSTKLSSRI